MQRQIITKAIAQYIQNLFKQLLTTRATYDSSLPLNLELLAIVYEKNIRMRCSSFDEYENECNTFVSHISDNRPLKAVVFFDIRGRLTDVKRAQVRNKMIEVIKYNSDSEQLRQLPSYIIDNIVKRKEAEFFKLYLKDFNKRRYIHHIERSAWMLLVHNNRSTNQIKCALTNIAYPSVAHSQILEQTIINFAKASLSSSAQIIKRCFVATPQASHLDDHLPTSANTQLSLTLQQERSLTSSLSLTIKEEKAPDVEHRLERRFS